jgi:hypothetical protein
MHTITAPESEHAGPLARGSALGAGRDRGPRPIGEIVRDHLRELARGQRVVPLSVGWLVGKR